MGMETVTSGGTKSKERCVSGSVGVLSRREGESGGIPTKLTLLVCHKIRARHIKA